MKSFAQHTQENRRLAMLKLLADAGGSANESVIHTALTNLLGFPLTARGDVRQDLEWMRERLLIGLEKLPVAGDRVLLVAKITDDGLDAAFGRGAPVEGIARPAIAG